MKRIKNILLSMVAVFSLAAPLTAPVLVSAETTTTPEADIDGGLACGGNLVFSTTDPATDCATDDSTGQVDSIVTAIVNVLSVVVGTVAVIMIIIGGLQYVMSGGDSGKVGNSKNTILYAVVGLVVVALAQVIVKFTINRSTPA